MRFTIRLLAVYKFYIWLHSQALLRDGNQIILFYDSFFPLRAQVLLSHFIIPWLQGICVLVSLSAMVHIVGPLVKVCLQLFQEMPGKLWTRVRW